MSAITELLSLKRQCRMKDRYKNLWQNGLGIENNMIQTNIKHRPG